MESKTPSRLLVLWTTGDKKTASNMVFMYAVNAKQHEWFDEVTLLVWGAADRLAAEDAEVQERIAGALQQGLRVIACRRCAEHLDVVEDLENLGIEVFFTGEFLTNWLKSGAPLLSV